MKNKKLLIGIIAGVVVAITAIIIIICIPSSSDECDHTYGEWITTKEATCKETGLKESHCSKCDDVIEDTIPLLSEHSWNSGNIINDATCKEEGKKQFTCTVCGDSFDEVIPKLTQHAWDEGQVIDEATCKTEGKIKYTCTVCNETHEDTIPVTSDHNYVYSTIDDINHSAKCECGSEVTQKHTFVENIIKDPTCTEKGSKEVTCEHCDYYSLEEISATGHSWDIEERTCESGQSCSKCDATTPKLSHSYELVKTMNATCEEAGYREYKCLRCNHTYQEITKDATGHSVAKWNNIDSVVSESNPCQTVEHFEGTCTTCFNKVSKEEVVTKHSIVITIHKTAKCNDLGSKKHECENCDYVEYFDYENTEAHLYSQTETNGNIVTHTCDWCGNTKTTINASTEESFEIGKSELANNELELKNASIKLDEDTLSGLDDSDINLAAGIVGDEDRNDLVSSLTPEEKEALGNNTIYNFTLSQNDNNVTKFDGIVTVTVEYELAEGEDPESIAIWYINEEGKVEAIPAKYSNGYATFETKHFSYYTVTRLSPKERCALYGHHIETTYFEATCIADGYKIEVCTRCGNTNRTFIAPAFGHNYATVKVDPKCETNGSLIHTCKTCQYSYVDHIPALGHNYVVEDQVDATCEHAGYTKYQCSNCPAHYTKHQSQLNHVLIITIINPTCLEGGHRVSECKNCDFEKKDNYVKPLGHIYKETVVEPTCDNGGYTLHECRNCDDSYTDNEVLPQHTWNMEHSTCGADQVCVICGTIGEEKTNNHNLVNSVCTVCGHGCEHTFEQTVIEPTCDVSGYTMNVCTICDYTYNSDEVDPKGHSFSNFECTVCHVRVIEDKYFSNLAANMIGQVYTVQIKDFEITSEILGILTGEGVYIEGSLVKAEMLERVVELTISAHVDENGELQGFGYGEIEMNVGNNMKKYVIAECVLEDSELYVKLQNSELLFEEAPLYIYFPREIIFTLYETEMADQYTDLLNNHVNPLIQRLFRNNNGIDDTLGKVFSKYFTMKEEGTNYVFTSNQGALKSIKENESDKFVSDILGKDLMEVIESLPTISIGALLDKIEKTGTSFKEIKPHIDAVVDFASEGEYKTLFAFITDVYGLKVILDQDQLYNYTFVSFLAELTDTKESECVDKINESIDNLKQTKVKDLYSDFNENDINDILETIDENAYVVVTTTKDGKLQKVEVKFTDEDKQNTIVTIYADYKFDYDMDHVISEVQEFTSTISFDDLDEDYEIKEVDGKVSIVYTDEEEYINSSYEDIEYDEETNSIRRVLRIEKTKYTYTKIYDFDYYGFVRFNPNFYDDEIIFYMPRKSLDEYSRITEFYDISTNKLIRSDVELENNYDSEYWSLDDLSIYNHIHTFEYSETLSILTDQCGEIGQEVYVCSSCNAQKTEYYINTHNYSYEYEFLTDIRSCYEGVKVTLHCLDCEKDLGTYTFYNHIKLDTTIDLSSYEGACDGETYISACPCGSNAEIYHNYDKHHDQLYCDKCDLSFSQDYDEHYSQCKNSININYVVRYNNQIIKEHINSYERINHEEYIFIDLLPGSTTCTEGYTAKYICFECGNEKTITSYECLDSDSYRTFTLLWDLNVYGIDAKVYRNGHPHDNSNRDNVIVIGEYNRTYVDNYEVYEFDEAHNVVIGCETKELKDCEVSQTKYAYLNFDFTSESYDQKYKLSEYTTTDHEMKEEYILIDGKDCENGVKIKYSCVNCVYIETSTYYYHRTIDKEILNFKEYGCEHGTALYEGTCLCGYESEISKYNMTYTSMRIGDVRYYGYKCYDCSLFIVEDKLYDDLGDCKDKVLVYYSIYYDKELVGSYILKDSIEESHNYVRTFHLLDDSLTCEDGYYEIKECMDCGHKEVVDGINYYHNEGVIETIDLTKYGATKGYIQITGCACGELIDIHTHSLYSYNRLDENHFMSRSYIDGFTVYVEILDDINECIIERTVNVYVGYDKETENYMQKIVYKFNVNHHKLTQTGYKYLVENDCSAGAYVYYKCDVCNETFSMYESDPYIIVEIDRIKFTEYECDAYISVLGVPCTRHYHDEKQYSPVGFEETIDSGYDEVNNIEYNNTVYTHEESGISFEITRNKIFLDICHVKNVYSEVVKLNGEVIEILSYNEYISENHDYEDFVTLSPGSESCEDGALYVHKCIYCGKVEDSWSMTYHNTGIVEYIDLTLYGAQEGHIEIYGCACGYYGNNFHIDCFDEQYLDDQSQLYYGYSDGYCIKVTTINEYDGCRIKTYYQIYLDYNLEEDTYKYEFKFLQSSFVNHTYEYEYELMKENSSCEDGVLVTKTCSVCSHVETDIDYYHVEIEEYVEIEDGECTCDEHVVIRHCLCDYYYNVMIESVCDFDSDFIQISDEEGYNIYICAVTEPQCTFAYIVHNYTVTKNCVKSYYIDYYLGYRSVDDLTNVTPDYHVLINQEEVHNFETTSETIDTNIPCYKYHKETSVCHGCGLSSNAGSYYFFDHTLDSIDNVDEEGNGTISDKCTLCSYESTEVYKNHLIVESKVSEPSIIYVKGDMYCSTMLNHFKYMYRGNTQLITYKHTSTTYPNELTEKGYKSHSLTSTYVYDFTKCCHVTITTIDTYGNSTIEEIDFCKPMLMSEVTIQPTCTQYGSMRYILFCELCGHTSPVKTASLNPKGHQWEYNDTYGDYECINCHLLNMNGADGNVVLEDLSNIDNNEDTLIVGYWNMHGYKYDLYVSIMVMNEYGEQEQIVLENIEITDKYLGKNYIMFKLSDVQTAVNDLNMGLTDDMYDIRLSFVPFTFGLDLDYAITLTN